MIDPERVKELREKVLGYLRTDEEDLTDEEGLELFASMTQRYMALYAKAKPEEAFHLRLLGEGILLAAATGGKQ